MKHTLQALSLSLTCLFSASSASAQYIIHIAGSDSAWHNGDTTEAISAQLRCPTSVCRDNAGNLYIADGGPFGYKNDGCIRKIDAATGIINTIAGVIGAADSASNVSDNIPAVNAKLQGSSSVCIDKEGNLLIADGVSTVRKIDLTTGIITTVAGIRNYGGYAGDGGPATSARLDKPWDVAVDGANNIYIADKGNHCIRKVFATGGFISTVAGRGAMGSSGDGGAAVFAKLNNPTGVYVDNSNNIFIADYNNNRVRVVSGSSGIITTIAGSFTGFSGDGGLAVNARLSQPTRVVLDKDGNIYISDAANQRIRKITASTGIITTFAGNGLYFTGPDVLGDYGPATAASISPYGMCFDPCGNMFVGSALYSIRAITSTLPKTTLICGFETNSVSDVNVASETTLSLSPNPNNGQFSIRFESGKNEKINIIVTDITGRKVLEQNAVSGKDIILNIGNTPGLYLARVSSETGSWTKKIAVQ